jgi:ribosomal protein S13
MKKDHINLDKLHTLQDADYGVKSYSRNYMLKRKGYNLRYQPRYIKQKDYATILAELEYEAEERAVEADESGLRTQKREVLAHIEYKVFNSSYEGDRHEKNLPVRGQRSKTNARNSKNRKFKIKPALEDMADDMLGISDHDNKNKKN